jgi:HEAT repeat protein
MDKVDLLIEILLDVNARIDERDDAAMDLGKYDDDRALNALLSIVLDPNAEPFILDVCGESIAEIWVKRNYFNFDLYKKMASVARNELYSYVKTNKPKWIKEHNLDED